MIVNSEQMGGEQIATDQMRDRDELGEVDPLPDDAKQSVEDLETVGSALEEANADVRTELARANERLRAAEPELDPGRAESDAVAAGATAAETQAAPNVADAVKTASHSAVRLLEIATRNADALVEDAQKVTDQMVTEARAHAERMIQASLADAKAREETMSARAEAQRVELERTRDETLRQLEERRAELEAQVNRLAEFERQYRNHLTSYLSGQLETLQRPTIAETLATADAEHPRPS